MRFHLFTNKLQTITSILLVQNKLLNRYLQIIYIKSHKFITHERPHEQSSRIKPPSTLPVFLITGAAKRTA